MACTTPRILHNTKGNPMYVVQTHNQLQQPPCCPSSPATLSYQALQGCVCIHLTLLAVEQSTSGSAAPDRLSPTKQRSSTLPSLTLLVLQIDQDRMWSPLLLQLLCRHCCCCLHPIASCSLSSTASAAITAASVRCSPLPPPQVCVPLYQADLP